MQERIETDEHLADDDLSSGGKCDTCGANCKPHRDVPITEIRGLDRPIAWRCCRCHDKKKLMANLDKIADRAVDARGYVRDGEHELALAEIQRLRTEIAFLFPR